MKNQTAFAKFDTYYTRLNPEQKKAVDTIEGPVMVIAGPGTGKTQILTLRIANILKTVDIEPENILAVTFTESGVASMRKRLAEMIGTPAYHVKITTFHSFCNDVIKQYPEEFDRIIGAQSITEIEQIQIVQHVIDHAQITILRPFGDRYYYVRSALATINDLKREGVTPERFREIISEEAEAFEAIDDLYYDKGAHKGKMKGKYQDQQKYLNKNQELTLIYETYQQRLAELKRYDYSDMILEVSQRLAQNEDLLLTLQERYQYILVDEHQDTNNAQNAIIQLLANFHDNPNLFVVGDEKQAIFKFQGASLENFLYFKHLYPGVTLITLRHNYRSTQSILDSADALSPGHESLLAHSQHPERPIGIYAVSSKDVEYYTIAKAIEQLIAQGESPREIAVIYRNNADAFPIAHMFEKFGIPFSLESSWNLLDDDNIRKLFAILQALNDFGSDELLLKALHCDFFKLQPLDIYKISHHAFVERKSVYDIINSETVLAELSLTTTESFTKVAGLFNNWQIAIHNKSFLEVFEEIVRESGYQQAMIQAPDYITRIEKLTTIFEQLRDLVDNNKDYGLKDFMAHIAMLKEHNILIRYSPRSEAKGVRLMTAHGSKGLEFDYVFIVNVIDGQWGNKRTRRSLVLPDTIYSLTKAPKKAPASEEESAEAPDDERNLFYVALTRARKEIFISYATTGETGRAQLPSVFVGQIKPELIEERPVEAYEQAFASEKHIIFAEKKATEAKPYDSDFFRMIFIQQGLNVSALNNYLKCPWKYFYINLVRFPQAQNKFALYGTAIHYALTTFFDQQTRQKNPTEQSLIESFESKLTKLPLSALDYAETLAKGRLALKGYYDTYHAGWHYKTLSEMAIKGIELTPDIKIRGAIDKMELVNANVEDTSEADMYRGPVIVIDFKTGHPKSRSKIEGDPEQHGSDYRRQLTFYNLLLNKYQDGRYEMTAGVIDFVEPDEKGKYHREVFQFAPEDLEALEQLIIKVGEEIMSLAFWNKTCDDETCEYCALRASMSAS